MAVTRGAAAPVELIRKWVTEGRYDAGAFLPPIREISTQCGVSPETVRRGLKYLESEGLVSSEPRQGFRVNQIPMLSREGKPFAYVTNNVPDLSDGKPVNWALNRAITREATARGGMALGLHVGTDDSRGVPTQLKASGVSGVILETMEPAFLDTITQTGIPTVMVNSWFEDHTVDVVIQDNFLGGFLAARHLVLEAGAKRIAWVGPVEQFCHSRERFSGAIAGLAASGHAPEMDVLLNTGGPAAFTDILRAFKRTRRPDGVLAFGPHVGRGVKQAAEELNLKLGKDLTVVGWTVEECDDSQHVAIYEGGPIPPAIVWTGQDMAAAAVHRLDVRCRGEAVGPLRMLIPTRLKHYA